MPPGRSPLYAEWRACERFGLIPSNVNPKWDENAIWVQALLLSYSQIRGIEESDNQMAPIELMMAAMVGKK